VPRATTPSFITEIPLVVASQDEAEISSRFQAGRQLYNALLNESMVRMNLVRSSDLFQDARKLPKGKIRNDAFAAARKEYRYSEYDIQAYATVISKGAVWIAQKVDSNTQQTLASRAFKASEKVMFGRAKKVRFKVPNRFNSMEGKSNKQGIRWDDNQFVWGKLRLNAMIDPENPVMMHGLESRIKYVRLTKKDLNGKHRWFAQLICEGVPYQKSENFVTPGTVGLDLNVSNVAYVADNNAGLLPFAEKVPTFEREIKAAQRKMQRSQRRANPDNYEPDFNGRKGRKTVTKKGKVKKGKRKWNKSKRYIKLASKKRELERRKAAYSKSQNRKLVNDILRNGNQIKTENVSVKGWQKRYGKAIAAKSPGYFQSELKRKAEGAGGSFTVAKAVRTSMISETFDVRKSQRVTSDS
jgi:putative transposase